jgi:6-phosphogluconolactonase (cycloisomerase 2 family)
VFSIDRATGKFTQVDHSPFGAGGTVAYVAAEPSGRYVYASQAGPPGVQAFTVDSSGALAKVTGSPFGTATVHAGALAFHPNGKFVYGASGLVSGFVIDVDSGALSALAGSVVDGGGSDPMAIDLAIDPSGRFAYAVRSATGALYAYTIDPDSGALALIDGSPYDGGDSAYSVAVDVDGRFVYVGNDDSDQMSVYAIDPTSGRLTAIQGSPFSPSGLEPEIVMARPASR